MLAVCAGNSGTFPRTTYECEFGPYPALRGNVVGRVLLSAGARLKGIHYLKTLLRSGNGEALLEILQNQVIDCEPRCEQPLAQKHWYATYTRSNHEAQVTRHLDVRGIESYLPHYQVVRRWKNRRTKHISLPLFPCYVFVHLALDERVRVLEVPGVLSLVGTATRPIALPDREIELLRTGLDRRRAEPHPYIKIGDRVRIKRGALAGLEGVVSRGKSLRVVISLDAIMKSVAVEVDWDEVEPIAGTAFGSYSA